MEVKFLNESTEYIETKWFQDIKTTEREEKTVFHNDWLLGDLQSVLVNKYPAKYDYPDDGEFHNQTHRLFLDAPSRYIREKYKSCPIYLEYADYVYKKQKMVKIAYELKLVEKDGGFGGISVERFEGSRKKLKVVDTPFEAITVAIKDIEKTIGGKIEDNKE